MILQFVKREPASRRDELVVATHDGATRTCDLPRQGVLPRLAVHFVVESTLDWRQGAIAALQDMARVCNAAGVPVIAASDTDRPAADAVVECLEMEQWSGSCDYPRFQERLEKTCAQSNAAVPAITPDQLNALRLAMREFGAAWRPLLPGSQLERTFPGC